ncbi:NAD-dependent epimerase/dehydratase family protein [Planomonospora parontospora]|uniref:NAD-dependent epimerase/dehydratase family protein n=1 Tax=Planomonospora parontospora TaxID=58119 RepID=UPI0016709510|nr:NAD-dependent epimerase/dehydratase family protein [Planomonospora parontospora]GGL32957.1 reductase [Planomonospora parontospora subsp. antibiotica]GII17001.1 reductase [Planomonospora parontospora subsp. antibiotica]
MRILIIGGTRFVGRHITEAALAAGHDVSLLHRGRTGPGLFPEAEHLLADRDTGLAVLDGREWDATIDVSAYLPSQIEALAGSVSTGRYVFVSTTAVYARDQKPGFTEDSPLAELDGDGPVPDTVTGETYGPLKVLCERTASGRFGPGTLVVRPTYVIGPYDYTGRFTYWVNRLARGGEVLAPGDPSAPIQVIDGRDMAAWIVAMAGRGDGGTFHAVSPPPPFTFGDMLEGIAAEVAPPGTTLTWVDTDFLHAAGQDGRSLPLWGEGEDTSINTADPSAARAAGLDPRPFRQSVREIRGSEADFSVETTVAPAREAEILAAWHAR